MKNHLWLVKTDDAETPEAAAQRRRVEAFERLVADPGEQWRKAGGGAITLWEKVTAENKGSWLSLYAASYGVSYERFAQAVSDALDGRPLTAAEHRRLRGQFDAARKLVALDPDPTPEEPSPELEKNTGREI